MTLRDKSESLTLIHKRKIFGFKKGERSYWLGKKFSEEHRKNIRIAEKGRHPKSEFKKGHIPWNKGLTTDDPRVKKWHERSSRAQKLLFKEGKLIIWNKGKKTGFLSKNPEETRIKRSEALKRGYQNGRVSYFKGRYGKLHPRYKGKNCKKKQKRNDPAYANFVTRVKRRDNNTCQLKGRGYGECSGYNIVHHIRGWAKYPELRYNINNGITLCQFHHPLKKADEIKFIPIFEELVRQKH